MSSQTREEALESSVKRLEEIVKVLERKVAQLEGKVNSPFSPDAFNERYK